MHLREPDQDSGGRAPMIVCSFNQRDAEEYITLEILLQDEKDLNSHSVESSMFEMALPAAYVAKL